MEKLKFRTSAGNNGRIETIEVGGILDLETALELKNELVIHSRNLADEVKINISELEEMDLPSIQLMVAFLRHLDHNKIKYKINWHLEEEQKAFFINVGIGHELYMTN